MNGLNFQNISPKIGCTSVRTAVFSWTVSSLSKYLIRYIFSLRLSTPFTPKPVVPYSSILLPSYRTHYSSPYIYPHTSLAPGALLDRFLLRASQYMYPLLARSTCGNFRVVTPQLLRISVPVHFALTFFHFWRILGVHIHFLTVIRISRVIWRPYLMYRCVKSVVPTAASALIDISDITATCDGNPLSGKIQSRCLYHSRLDVLLPFLSSLDRA